TVGRRLADPWCGSDEDISPLDINELWASRRRCAGRVCQARLRDLTGGTVDMLTGAPRKRGEARERLLQLAETAVLEKGFVATSIDELIAAAGITKSGFFYHFKDKTELARVLLERYIARENALFDELFARADELNEDPLHGFLVGLKM